MLNLEDGTEDSVLANDSSKNRSDTVDLSDQSLVVTITEAVCQIGKIKFTLHTKTTLPAFAKSDFSVERQHKDFVWLHNTFEENEKYAEFTIPPAPPFPDLDASLKKLEKLRDEMGNMTQKEFLKKKKEIEKEHVEIFTEKVAKYDVFLQTLTCHSVFKNDTNLKVFLECEEDLTVKNKRKLISDILGTLGKRAEDLLLIFMDHLIGHNN